MPVSMTTTPRHSSQPDARHDNDAQRKQASDIAVISSGNIGGHICPSILESISA
jgi:hypothetical protein